MAATDDLKPFTAELLKVLGSRPDGVREFCRILKRHLSGKTKEARGRAVRRLLRQGCLPNAAAWVAYRAALSQWGATSEQLSRLDDLRMMQSEVNRQPRGRLTGILPAPGPDGGLQLTGALVLSKPARLGDAGLTERAPVKDPYSILDEVAAWDEGRQMVFLRNLIDRLVSSRPGHEH